MAVIQFFFLNKKIGIRNIKILKQFIEEIFQKEKIKLVSLSYIFCSDEDLLSINHAFLQHDYYTDVITFNLSPVGQPVEAEIYISTDRVKDNAQIFEVSVKSELHRVMFHGALHLCGYKDRTEREKQKMRKIEDHYLTLYKA